MHPILTTLELGELSRPIGSYGVMMSTAVLVITIVFGRVAHRHRMDMGAIFAVIGFTAMGGFLGALSLYALVEAVRTGNPLQGVMNPGLVFFGAPLGGTPAMIWSARALEIPLGRAVDLGIPAIPAAHAMGRIGCFLGGCCFGKEWHGPFAASFTHPIAPASFPPGITRHPVQLYEAGALLIIALLLAVIPPKRVGTGARAFLYFAIYGVLRLCVEGLRGDTVRGLWFGLISTSQLIGLAVTAACVFVLVRLNRQSGAEPA